MIYYSLSLLLTDEIVHAGWIRRLVGNGEFSALYTKAALTKW